MRRRLFLAVFILMAVNASSDFAWGDAGHRIICQIAYLELKPDIKARVDALIAIDPKFRTFADGCTWADKFPRQTDVSDQPRLLKSLGHWVGDIHQPLHISFEDDRGGNEIQVSGLCPRTYMPFGMRRASTREPLRAVGRSDV